MVSTKARSPIFCAGAQMLAPCGAWVMLSWPPATTMALSPVRDLLGRQRHGAQAGAAKLVDAEGGAAPPGCRRRRAAWRAGFCPALAVSIWPRITSSTSPAWMPARSMAAWMATVPSACAGQRPKAPLKLPTGVRRGGDDDIVHDCVLPPWIAAAQFGPRHTAAHKRALNGRPLSQGCLDPAPQRLPQRCLRPRCRRPCRYGPPPRDAPPPPGIARPGASAVSGGTMRSRAGMARKLGSRRPAGSTAAPATRHSPRAGVLAPYQPARHSRATGAASGTPSFSQSSSATNRRARGLAGSSRRNRGTCRRWRRDRARRTAPGWRRRAARRLPHQRLQPRQQAADGRGAPRSAAWKSQGVASSARAAPSRAGAVPRRAAAARPCSSRPAPPAPGWRRAP